VKLLFAGTPEIAATVLQRLLDSEHEVVAVLTQPDRPAGRGRKCVASPVKALALAHQKPVLQPLKLKDAEIQEALKAYNADLMVVVAYGLIVPEAVLQIPKLGCWNIHVSLLPRWRGAAPIQRAIEAGDVKTGVTLMQMDSGLDTGSILLQEECAITRDITAGLLHDALARQGAQMLMQGLQMQEQGKLQGRPQAKEGVTYANKLTKEEAQIDWSLSAEELDCKIRAFNPFPMCRTTYRDQVIRIWQAKSISDKVENGTKQPGQIVYMQSGLLGVQTGQGILEILHIQLSGAKALPVSVFLNGHRDFFEVGQCFT